MTDENTCIIEECAFQQMSKANILQAGNQVFMKSYKGLWMVPTEKQSTLLQKNIETKTEKKSKNPNVTRYFSQHEQQLRLFVSLICETTVPQKSQELFNMNNKGKNRKPTKLGFWSMCRQEYICEAHKGAERI